MYRLAFCILAAGILVPATLHAGVACDDLGVGINLGMMQPIGCTNEFADSGLNLGLQVSKPINDMFWVALDYRHGETQNKPISEIFGTGRFTSWGVPDEFRTVWNTAALSAVWNIMPSGKVRPFVSAGMGMTFWQVEDWRDDQGDVPVGYDNDGKQGRLRGENLTGIVGAGVEFFTTERMAIAVGGRYSYLFKQKLDSCGLSVVGGPEYVDLNNTLLEGYVALTYYFGPGDCDGDGIIGNKDKCPRDPEDFDGFQDEDGCPDPDNDADGILDVDDLCPDQPEDFNGYQDEDGCPDADTDGDGVIDIHDKCPGTPRGTPVDADGCPKPVPIAAPQTPAPAEIKPQLLAVTVNFPLNSTVLDGTAKDKLDALARAMAADPELMVRVGGHACDLGSDEYNQRLSERRAVAVKKYLVDKGISDVRITAAGFGEISPLFANTSESNRSQNRRAIIEPVR
jgi:outer membrane protein OmpA-like peptidoglycan-associated protein/opacity protein-like surface antigen